MAARRLPLSVRSRLSPTPSGAPTPLLNVRRRSAPAPPVLGILATGRGAPNTGRSRHFVRPFCFWPYCIAHAFCRATPSCCTALALRFERFAITWYLNLAVECECGCGLNLDLRGYYHTTRRETDRGPANGHLHAFTTASWPGTPQRPPGTLRKPLRVPAQRSAWRQAGARAADRAVPISRRHSKLA